MSDQQKQIASRAQLERICAVDTMIAMAKLAGGSEELTLRKPLFGF